MTTIQFSYGTPKLARLAALAASYLPIPTGSLSVLGYIPVF